MWRRRFTAPCLGAAALKTSETWAELREHAPCAGAVALATAAANGVPPASDVFDALRETAERKKWDGCRGHGVIDAAAAVDTVSTGGIKIAGMSPSTVAGALLASVALSGLAKRYLV